MTHSMKHGLASGSEFFLTCCLLARPHSPKHAETRQFPAFSPHWCCGLKRLLSTQSGHFYVFSLLNIRLNLVKSEREKYKARIFATGAISQRENRCRRYDFLDRFWRE